MQRTRCLVRSAVLKLQTGVLVLRRVTTGESPLFYVCFLAFFWWYYILVSALAFVFAGRDRESLFGAVTTLRILHGGWVACARISSHGSWPCRLQDPQTSLRPQTELHDSSHETFACRFVSLTTPQKLDLLYACPARVWFHFADESS